MNVAEKVSSRRRRVSTPQRAELLAACDEVTRLTGLRRLKLNRLDETEQFALLDLRRKFATEGGGTNLAALDKGEQRKLEELTEKLAGDPGHFERERNEASLRAQVNKLARRALKPPRRLRYEQADSITIPATITHLYATEKLDLVCFALLVDHVTHMQVVGRDHIVNAGAPFGRHDPTGLASGGARGLKRLAEAGWLVTEPIGGGKVRVRNGSKLVQAFAAMERER